MTESTKKLFNAPWSSEEYEHGHGAWVVRRPEGYLIAENMSGQDANRLARLPELYDALVNTVYLKCFKCMGGLRHNIDLTREELVKSGCPKQNKSNVCIYCKHLELLRKVRDGK